MEKNSHIKIILEEMSVDVRIGLHPHEKKSSQRVFVNIELFTVLGDYLDHPKHESIIDYDVIRKAVKSWSQRPHTLLIETYLKELVEICFEDPRIEACRVSVTKPDIFKDVERAGVEVFVRRDDFKPPLAP